MKAYVFPGQGAQFTGMGKDLYEASDKAKDLFAQANEVLGFDITKIMFEGTAEELKETKHPIDSSASAAVIFKTGETDFNLSNDGEWKIITEVNYKIKI